MSVVADQGITESAFYFGPPESPLFGCLHGPADGGASGSRQAVVLCSATGSEELSAHRAWRELARRLASSGHSVLRFDYAGTGDSFGDHAELDAVSTGIASVRWAIDEVKRLSGRQQVTLVGLREGAALAWQASQGRTDVVAWVGVAPVISGRQYVRELQALQAAAGLLDTLPPERGLESGGFFMSAGNREALSALDLRTPEQAAVAHALILERTGRPLGPGFARTLNTLGVNVASHVLNDLEDLLLEPHHSKVPDSAWQQVVTWVAALPPSPLLQPLPVPGGRAGRWLGVTEQPVSIATRSARLAAVLSRSEEAATSGRAVLFLNGGAIRRIGPGRFHVTMARDLAMQGDLALRLDLSGLGDSPATASHDGTVVYSPTAVDEVVDTVQEVLRWPGIRECAVVGLCAGAYHGLRAAIAGAPVRNVVAINPLTYYWEEGLSPDAPPRPHEVIGEVARYRSIVFTLTPWIKLLRGEAHVRRMLQLLARGATRHLNRWGRDWGRRLGLSLHQDLGRELSDVAHRGVRVDFIFAEGEPGEPLLRDQSGAMLPRLLNRGAVHLWSVPRADHVFLNFTPRQRMMELIHLALGTKPRKPPMPPQDALAHERSGPIQSDGRRMVADRSRCG